MTSSSGGGEGGVSVEPAAGSIGGSPTGSELAAGGEVSTGAGGELELAEGGSGGAAIALVAFNPTISPRKIDGNRKNHPEICAVFIFSIFSAYRKVQKLKITFIYKGIDGEESRGEYIKGALPYRLCTYNCKGAACCALAQRRKRGGEAREASVREVEQLTEHDMCGIFGILGHEEAANLAYLGLHALQHRGQESAGIAASDGQRLSVHRAMGLVQEAFPQQALERLLGDAAIGHVRYSTAGGSGLRNAQPLAVDFALGSLAVAHNGNLTNAENLRQSLEAHGSIFQSSADTETIVHLIAISQRNILEERVVEALLQVEGAYSLLFLTPQQMIAVRDPWGIRPLCLGKHRKSGAPVVASESVSFDLIEADFVREIEPGEMLVMDRKGAHSRFPFQKEPRRECIFEHVYFARPDSRVGHGTIYEMRRRCGEVLAQENPADADVVIAVPDSGVPAAIGFAHASKIPYEVGLTRSHYIGRTFIEPQQSIRHFGVRLKLNPVRSTLEGRRVVVIDDSIVRGTTSRKIVKMLRDAGAREVHVRISSPPTRWPCYYGIDTPTRGELIAASHSPEQIARYLTADSLGYLSLNGLVETVASVAQSPSKDMFCHACFSGTYPIPFAAPSSNRQLRLIQ